MKVWQCGVCKYIHREVNPVDKCPICNVESKKFREIDEASIPGNHPKRRGVKEKRKTEETWGFEKIKSLMVKHHTHPVIVHMPNGLLPVAVILWLAAWIFNSQLLAQAAFINQIFVIASLPLVIFTGIIEWQQKYNKAMTKIFKIKITAAGLTSISCLISTVWFYADSDVLLTSRAWGFMLINIIMLASAGIAGHFGGKLVFKD